ncbi:SPFH domain-containing protein [Xylanibacillus composti]|uniref:Membrane protease subunit (Stomatin/prohibitin family) n=1 Tax=Xylanibacillus composti TaxID=1572762 RepID=A0A8J4M497_9BACL|nr:SPFH domain-containing protein [Xylanibacillus composti]MDT9726403.1 SPFH domain-containing protein [Xylanibacillus composti]GIQ70356.1 hypothetical protein XYCOK13_31800 [Xylanibacillus composti]
MAIIDVIKFDGIANRDWLVYRYPGDNFANGTQLIVGEGQVAIFVKGGQAVDYYTAGTYTLKTENVPFLRSLINLPFGGKTPFTAEVFFINKAAKLDLLWGTSDPVSLIDPKYGVRLRVRAFGQLGLRIEDFRVFLTELIGAVGQNRIVKYDTVIGYFRGEIVTTMKSVIADVIINKKISVLEIAPHLDELSDLSRDTLMEEFERFGVKIVNFHLKSINFPDEDFDMINKLLGEKAAFDIFGDQRYNVKRTFDVMETAAGNEGQGSLAAAGLGLGLGAGAGATISSRVHDAVNASASTSACTKCGQANPPGTRFCTNCGEKQETAQISCYSCNASIAEGVRFCPECGASMEEKRCPGCGGSHRPGTKFCPECGTRMEE